MIGQCNMSVEQAGWITTQEYTIRYRAYERREREKWERARWQMYLIMQMHPNIKKVDKPGSPSAWIRFPWENPVEGIKSNDCHIDNDKQEQLDELLHMFIKRKTG